MRIWYVICFLLLSGCWSNKPKNEAPQISQIDSLYILDIIHTALTDSSISWIGKKGHQVLSKTQMLPPPSNFYESYVSYVSRILSEKDTLCIGSQLQLRNRFTTTGMENFGYTVVNLENDVRTGTFWETFHEEYGEGFLTVSMPVFDCNRIRAFIRLGFVCGGKCGGGEDIVLEQINGRWVLREKVHGWVSRVAGTQHGYINHMLVHFVI